MSRYSQTTTFTTIAAKRRAVTPRAALDWIIERIRTARYRRRQCQELMDYLASDHRAARDLMR